MPGIEDTNEVTSVFSDPSLLIKTIGIGRGSGIVTSLILICIFFICVKLFAGMNGTNLHTVTKSIIEGKNNAVAIYFGTCFIALAALLIGVS